MDKPKENKQTPAIPSKSERQAAFRLKVQQESLSNKDAVRRAELIPPEIVAQFKLVKWPK
ncbi:hypothetical protein [Sulfurirhabdus autotrophica]|uniref:Uncharacterized protein n=1 Tax=Sulfurirhabdus autotrophica TaxID=1706046 RepID=A0A4R3XW10_9PROT|nr:hypothetical protein [Sulfurirhabdus autotrophica]TCV81070.1 hypothetical protein EDC63_12728 [Sulfurirhabdus autotrophica]